MVGNDARFRFILTGDFHMTVSSLPYAVVGVTGRTGAAAADTLLRAGQAVRVVVRDPAQGRAWAERGAEVAVADLTDLAALTRALDRVRGAYLVCPQEYGCDDLFERAALIAETTARAALAAEVPRLVALSSMGADRASGTGWIGMNRTFEGRLGATGIAATWLRAAYFMENWTPLVGQAIQSGTLPSFLAPPQRTIPMVATTDVGSTAAALLQDAWTGTRIVTLAGPKAYAPDDVAAIVAAASGTPMRVAALAEADWPGVLSGAGFSQAALAGFTDMTHGLNSGHIDIGSDPCAVARAGTTPLESVIADLVRAGRGR